MAKVERELMEASDAITILFKRGVILAEGPSEEGAFPAWEPSIEGKDFVVYAVGGGKNFETYIWYAEQFAIPWIIFCDGPAIGDAGQPCRIAKQVEAATQVKRGVYKRDDFQTRCKKLGKCGVFTVASAATDEFEQLSVIQTTTKTAQQNVGPKSKVRTARWIAKNRPCPPLVASELMKGLQALMSRSG